MTDPVRPENLEATRLALELAQGARVDPEKVAELQRRLADLEAIAEQQAQEVADAEFHAQGSVASLVDVIEGLDEAEQVIGRAAKRAREALAALQAAGEAYSRKIGAAADRMTSEGLSGAVWGVTLSTGVTGAGVRIAGRDYVAPDPGEVMGAAIVGAVLDNLPRHHNLALTAAGYRRQLQARQAGRVALALTSERSTDD